MVYLQLLIFMHIAIEYRGKDFEICQLFIEYF